MLTASEKHVLDPLPEPQCLLHCTTEVLQGNAGSWYYHKTHPWCRNCEHFCYSADCFSTGDTVHLMVHNSCCLQQFSNWKYSVRNRQPKFVHENELWLEDLEKNWGKDISNSGVHQTNPIVFRRGWSPLCTVRGST